MTSEPSERLIGLLKQAPTRRGVLAALAGILSLRVFGPGEETLARSGVNGGQIGGRRGKDQRGRHRHGDRKGKHKNRNKKQNRDSVGGLYRNVSLEVKNSSTPSRTYEFYSYEEKNGVRNYQRGLPPGTLAAQQKVTFQSTRLNAAVWIDGKYWLEATNPKTGYPKFELWVGGVVAEGTGHSGGSPASPASYALDENEFQDWKTVDLLFRVSRRPDSSSFKEMAVEILPL